MVHSIFHLLCYMAAYLQLNTHFFAAGMCSRWTQGCRALDNLGHTPGPPRLVIAGACPAHEVLQQHSAPGAPITEIDSKAVVRQ